MINICVNLFTFSPNSDIIFIFVYLYFVLFTFAVCFTTLAKEGIMYFFQTSQFFLTKKFRWNFLEGKPWDKKLEYRLSDDMDLDPGISFFFISVMCEITLLLFTRCQHCSDGHSFSAVVSLAEVLTSSTFLL